MRRLAAAGVPVGVNVAPVIPGLNDHEIPAILETAREAGASSATFILLRLPHGVATLFEEWLDRCWPDRRAKVMERIRDTRGGRLYDARFRVRGRGEGEYAGQIRALFSTTASRLGLDRRPPELSSAAFTRPRAGTRGAPAPHSPVRRSRRPRLRFHDSAPRIPTMEVAR
jgi:DNA repair photolyase